MDGKFIISEEDWNTIINYSQMSYDKHKAEIGGMCIAVYDKENDRMIIKNPVIGKQTVSGGDCTLDKEWLADYYTKMAMEHGVHVRFVWWHSHHNMGVQWSGTDLAAMKEFSGGDYSMSLVVNLKDEHQFRVNWWKPTAGYIDTKLKIMRNEFEITEEMEIAFKELVTKESYDYNKWYSKSDKAKSISNGYGNTYYKQPGNYGPGAVDAELMDTPETLSDKYLDIIENMLDDAFVEQPDWITFKKEWDIIAEDAKIHKVKIKSISKNDYSQVLQGLMLDATIFFEDASPRLTLGRYGLV